MDKFIIEIKPMNLLPAAHVIVSSVGAAERVIDQIAEFDPLGVAEGNYYINGPESTSWKPKVGKCCLLAHDKRQVLVVGYSHQTRQYKIQSPEKKQCWVPRSFLCDG